MCDTSREQDLTTLGGYSIDKVCREGGTYKARVLFGHLGGTPCVIKDLSPMRPLLRMLYGRRMLGREARALELLAAFPWTPRLIERISPDAIAVERIKSKYKYLRSKIPREVLPAVLTALEQAVADLHRNGFVHLDLRQRKNILVPTDQSVALIDFESSRNLGRGHFGQKILLPLFGWIDRAAVLKWKAKFAPEMLTTEDLRRAERYALWKLLWPWKRFGRWLRR
ncbi:MAG: lipopolysaccharide kinase InaA family protein [Planctomycetota bacterium]